MPLANDQLEQALAMAQMGQPTAPSHNPAAVSAQLQQALMQQNRANDMSYQRPRRMDQMGWGSALAELARPFVAKRNMKKANEELVSALGKMGDLDRHEKAIAEYRAGVAEAKKRRDELSMYEMKKGVDQQYAPQSNDTPEKIQILEYIKKLPPEEQQKAATMLDMIEAPKASSMGTATIGGNVVPTVDGVPQMDSPYGPSDATIKQESSEQDAAQDKESGQRILAEKMRGFNEIITDDSFRSAVGPFDASGLSRFFGGLANTKDSQILRKIDRLGGMEVLDLGARVLKGSQTEGEWARVGETMPADKDHPEVWYSWYDDALKTLMAGAPEMAEQLEPLRKNLYSYAGKSGSEWDRAGKYEPYSADGAGMKVGKYTVVSVD